MVINLNIGGTEKALLNMIADLSRERFDITVLMLEKRGGFLSQIPVWVHVDEMKNYKNMKHLFTSPPLRVVWNKLRTGKILQALHIAALHLLTKVTKDRGIYYNYLFKNIPKLTTKYDIAIAYAGPMDLISYFIAHKVRAKKKVQWIHFDITKIGINTRFMTKLYKHFDKVFTVSTEGREKFIQTIPSLADKTEAYYNHISKKLILAQAEEGQGFQDNFKGLRILTVGRLTMEKGQDIAMIVQDKLVKSGFPVRWYCLGNGSDKGKYEQMIEELNLEDHFILLGEDSNPYHYMKHCDIYVQPSRHEGFCITLSEAKILNKPIVTTNFTGAHEQIKNNETGFVVSIHPEEMYEAIVRLINNPNLRNQFHLNLAYEMVENKRNDFYALV